MKKPSTSAIALTLDVEWAAQAVVDDACKLLDERGLHATFFCTHPDIKVPGHERAIHPNFRNQGQTVRDLKTRVGAAFDKMKDEDLFREVLRATRAFCPEAVGTRSHSLFYDSLLLPLLHEIGVRYDSSYFMPLVAGVAPFKMAHGLLQFPIYYMDTFDAKTARASFDLSKLALDEPGFKVLAFHPNLVFTNVATNEQYEALRPIYHDPAALLAKRRSGRGARSLFIEILDRLAADAASCLTLKEWSERL